MLIFCCILFRDNDKKFAKKIILIVLLGLIVVVLSGCSNEKYSAIFKGESKNWAAVFKFSATSDVVPEDMVLYHYTLSYKHALKDLAALENISVGFVWFNKDAEMVTSQALAKTILNYDYDTVKENVVYKGDGARPKRLFTLFKTKMVVWEEPQDNKEFTVSLLMPKSELEKMASEMEFAVAWGDKIETFKILPQVMPGCPVELGRGSILLAGEAANFLNPMGEGISSALVSGHAAVEAVKFAYTKGKDVDGQALLNAYAKNIARERQHMARQWELLAWISPKFSYLNQRNNIYT